MPEARTSIDSPRHNDTKLSSSNDLGPPPRPSWQRLASAFKRRCNWARRRWAGAPTKQTPIEAAWAWLQAHPATAVSAYREEKDRAVLQQLGQSDWLERHRDRLTLSTATGFPQTADSHWLRQAMAAEAAFQAGRYEQGQRIMHWLRARQHVRRGFRFSLSELQQAELHWQFLASSVAEVAAAFARQSTTLPQEIHPDDGRLQTVRTWLQQFAADGMTIADVGCGSGRFLKHLQQEFPAIHWVGIDLSLEMLRHLPGGVQAICGSLLQLPVVDGAFDAAFCVEALEHSLLPEQACAELARVLRPAGRLLVIDKNAAYQSRSELEPWERWFTPSEVANWLELHSMRLEEGGPIVLGAPWQKRLFLRLEFLKNLLDAGEKPTYSKSI